MVAEGIIVMRTTEKFMKPFFIKIRPYSRVCATPRQLGRVKGIGGSVAGRMT
jgi:hypothetical protein